MKALTLTQPWASLVAIGAKAVETRSWQTSYRGPIAIHAAKGYGVLKTFQGLGGRFDAPHFYEALRPHYQFPAELPLGAIVAVADLVDVQSTLTLSGTVFWSTPAGRRWPALTEQERAFGDYGSNRYGWLLANVRPLLTPVPCRGALSLWEVPALRAEVVQAMLPPNAVRPR